MPLTLRPQEIPFDDAASRCFFDPARKPFVATRGAIDAFGHDQIIRCLAELRRLADEHDGIDYLQVFENPRTGGRLWFIEDGDGGAITALLPDDY